MVSAILEMIVLIFPGKESKMFYFYFQSEIPYILEGYFIGDIYIGKKNEGYLFIVLKKLRYNSIPVLNHYNLIQIKLSHFKRKLKHLTSQVTRFSTQLIN